MFNRREKIKEIKDKIYKILKWSERLYDNLTGKANELNKETKLATLVKEIEYGYKNIDAPGDVKLQQSKQRWEEYIKNNDINSLSPGDILNLAFVYDVINDDRYWSVLNNFWSEKLIFALVRNVHRFWLSIDNLNNKLDIFNKLLQKIQSSKKILQLWKKHPEIIIGTKNKSLEYYLIEKINFNILNLPQLLSDKQYEIKQSDSLITGIKYQFLIKLFQQKITSIDFVKILYEESLLFIQYNRTTNDKLNRWNETIIAYLIQAIDKCNYFKTDISDELNYKKKTMNFLLKRYGDPREETNYWHTFYYSPAVDILKKWLNEQDVRFFFDNLVDDETDRHDRKGFWLNYAKNITRAKFIVSTQTSAYIKNKQQIDKMYPYYAKNKRIYSLPKAKTNIFIIEIKNFVIIDFSEIGNACYVYEYEKYKKENIEYVLKTNDSRLKATENDFKNKDISFIPPIRHNASINNDKDWQIKMKNILNNNRF